MKILLEDVKIGQFILVDYKNMPNQEVVIQVHTIHKNHHIIGKIKYAFHFPEAIGYDFTCDKHHMLYLLSDNDFIEI